MTQEPRPIVNIADSIFVFMACAGFTCWVIANLGLVDYMGMTGPFGDLLLWFGSMAHTVTYLIGCGILYAILRVMGIMIEAPEPSKPSNDRLANKVYNVIGDEDIIGKATPAQGEWVQLPKVKKVQVRPPVMAGTCTQPARVVEKVRCRFCRSLNPVGEVTCQNQKCNAMLYDTPQDRVRVNE